MPRKTDGIEFEIHPRPTKGEDGKPLLYVRPAKGRKKGFPKLKLLGEHTDPKTIHGRDIKYTGIEFIPSKEFVKECGKNREGYRKSQAPVGNSQMYDAQAMEEALRQSLKVGYTTIPDFMIHSGLKRDSAKSYLNSLCYGEHPRLRRIRESRRYLYFPIKEAAKG